MYILESFALLSEASASCLIRQTHIYSITRDMHAVIRTHLTLMAILAKSLLQAQALATGSSTCSCDHIVLLGLQQAILYATM